MSTPLVFRRATSEDVPAIVALVESAYRGDVSRQGWTTEADMLDGQRTDVAEVTDMMSRSKSYFLLAELRDSLVGSVCLSNHQSYAHLGMFAVSPAQQASGIGRALLEHAESVARSELHARAVEMTVIAQRTELIAWYERRGYSCTGEERPFPYGDARFGLPRRADLRFIVLRKAV